MQEKLCSFKQRAWVEEWINNGFHPVHLAVIVLNLGDPWSKSFFLDFLLRRQQTLPINHRSFFELKLNFKVPLNLFPTFPDFQLQFGQQDASPFVKASTFGLLGLNWDLIVLTYCMHNGKTLYKAEIASSDCHTFKLIRDDMINKSIDSLKFVTEFDFRHSEFLYSGHLEQLALACPNLQRLNLVNKNECLSNLKGLQMISQNCVKLCGLNLMDIPVKKVEDQVKLWEILSDMKLTHLVVEVCVFQPMMGNKEHLVPLFERCSSLYGLELDLVYYYDICKECVDSGGQWSLLSHFPALKYCKLSTNEATNDIQDIVGGCKELLCLSYTSHFLLSLVSTYHSNLQQLCLDSFRTDLPDVFMETLSAHGGLVHVIVSVNSVTVEGVTSLVVNSPRLLTMIILTRLNVCNEDGCKVNSKDIISGLRKRFPGRKLFTAGDCRVVQKYKKGFWLLSEYVHGTDLDSLW